ncbi:hypothetical protein MBCUT_13800 [Methanobrevibacter cuticularis]|uniref:Uncharacterized protein n=1 Tax=Methanobrevibacter cuticularis TaxID=47311 RepID=A0A166DIL6_9EURY|nr:hypothetical protein [Methanobrevibacter cuticularis]KZX15640.1 hypothetical protein MBCUT_13800 [Methanobrevibacter cuticularis]
MIKTLLNLINNLNKRILQNKIIKARKLLEKDTITKEFIEIITILTNELRVEGHKSDITLVPTLRASALNSEEEKDRNMRLMRKNS